MRWTICQNGHGLISKTREFVPVGESHAAFAFLPEFNQRFRRFLLRYQHNNIGILRFVVPGQKIWIRK